MKKILVLMLSLVFMLSLAGCSDTTELEDQITDLEGQVTTLQGQVTDLQADLDAAELPEIPATVDMDNIDMYLGRPDVQYVDLRNFDDKMASGYIAGFEFIPFFDYLEATGAIVRNDGWNFAAADIVNQATLHGLFDDDKVIFLMCGSGTRAGYVKSALEELGFDDVYNVGGISVYDGDNKVLGDGTYNSEVQLPLPAVVDMTNIDMYLGRNDVQYVDLRNFDDKMASGYIAGFEFIPFFDYLEFSDILVRTDGWTHHSANIMNQAGLFGLFDENKAIFLMCGSGTRAGFVKSALEELGYTNVYNVGGISTYDGDNKVLGDGTYKTEPQMSGPFTPGTHFAVDPYTQYTTTITVNAHGYIEEVIFDAMYHGTTKNAMGDDYMLASGKSWASEAAELAAYVQMNQGFGNITLDVTDITGMNMLTAPRHIIYIDHTNSPDDVAGVTIGAEGFVLSWNLAVEMAGGTPIANVPTSEEWVEAHAPAFEYEDGVYFGMDEAHGYNVKVTIEDGVIVDVFFDALRAELEMDDNGTPGDETDDFYTGNVLSWTTKQVLGFDYNMKLYSGGTYEWFEMANMLGDAIVEAQQWDPLWVIILGGEGEHDKFDNVDIAEELCSQADVDAGELDAQGNACVLDAVKVEAYDADDYTVDAIAGVTIGIEGFKMAFDEAIEQAIPETE